MLKGSGYIAILLLILVVCALLWRSCNVPDMPDVQYVEREVVREVQLPVVRIQKYRDTVLDVRFVKVTTDRYFLDKAVRQVDSLRAVIREYAATRGDSVERIYKADTLVCNAGRCDTLSLSFLALSERFMLDYRPSPREVRLIERAVVVPHEVFPTAKKLEWFGYGFGAGVVAVLVGQSLIREQ